MAKCQSCYHGINSTYVREGANGSLKKIGYYCNTCNIHYNIDKKLHTVFRDSQTLKPVANFQDDKNSTTTTFKTNKNPNVLLKNSNKTSIARPRFELGSKAPKASMLVRYIRYLIILPGFPGILL